MTRSTLQKVAVAWCLVMVALLAAIQVSVATPPPLPLFLVFTGVWLFGAAMLWWVPLFGAIGTAVYGVILGIQVLAMHGPEGSSLLVAIGSFIGTLLALAFLVERRRSG